MTNRDEQLEAKLRARPLPGLSGEAKRRLLADLATETVADPTVDIRDADSSPIINLKRTRTMKRIAKFAVAATVLAVIGILLSGTIGGSGSIAFAQVASVLESLQSATYDMTSHAKGEDGQPNAAATGKGYFLAPAHQRIEMSLAAGPTKTMGDFVTIVDGQAATSLMLMPTTKLAVLSEMKDFSEDIDEFAEVPRADVFETVRRLVREGSSTGEEAERLGEKEVDGRKAVGFRVKADMMDMTLWADPETAFPIRVEIVMDVMTKVRMVMSNFRYNVDLDPSLFSLEPPEGYSTEAVEMTIPSEEDLLETLRALAEQSKGVFPAKLEMNKEVMELLMAGSEPMIEELAEKKIEAAMNKVAAKYGGKEKLKEKYGKDIPPEILAEIQQATMPLIQEETKRQLQEQLPLTQKRMRGMTFYVSLMPENDPHYVGDGVKLGTPDHPILWYKPTGIDTYSVIYADLSVKELTPEEVKKVSEAKGQ